MDKKLSDNEIVKALDNDCLCVVYGVDFESCPLREKDCKILPEAIKDLIHRLQGEKKELKSIAEYQQGSNMERWRIIQEKDKTIAEQKEEIERLKIDIKTEKNWGKIQTKQAVKNTAKEILDEVSKHFGGKWLVELYKKYGLEWSVEVE